MKNLQHKYILKAFINSKIPAPVRNAIPDQMLTDDVLGGYCTQLLCGAKRIQINGMPLVSKKDSLAFSSLINSLAGADKNETVTYYRLMVLVESVLMEYNVAPADKPAIGG